LEKLTKAALYLTMFLFSSSIIASDDVIKFCEDPWPPYTIGVETGEPTGGVATDIIKEIFRRIGKKVDLRLYPWTRCLNQMKTGERDALMLLTKNKQRQTYMVYSDKIFENRDLIWYKKNRKGGPIEWSSFKDLRNFTIAKSSGYNYGDKYIEAEKKYKFKVDVAYSDKFGFSKILYDRVDIFFCNEAAAKEMFKTNPKFKGKFQYAKKPLKTVDLFLAISKKSKAVALIPQINNTISDMKKDGTIKKIINKYIE